MIVLFMCLILTFVYTEGKGIVEGLFPAVFTPMDEWGRVDVSFVKKYAKYLKKYDINGVVDATGEGPALTLEERKDLLSAWTVAALPSLKVISQVGGGLVFEDVIRLATYSELVGVYAILILPEMYFKPNSSEQLVVFLEKVARAAPYTHLLYYDCPEKTGVHVNLAELFKMASSKIPNFKGIKTVLSRSMQIKASNKLKKDQNIYISEPELLAASYELGFNTSIGAVANIFPKLTVQTIRAVKDGQFYKARVLQARLNEIVAAIIEDGDYEPSMKTAMEIVTGLKLGEVRYPLNQLTVHQKQALAWRLSKLDVKVHRKSRLQLPPPKNFSPLVISTEENGIMGSRRSTYLY